MSDFSFPGLSRDVLNEPMQAAWDKSMGVRGEARFVAAAGHAPELFNWYSESFYQQLFFQGRVGRRYKELGRLRLSTLHGCRSCNKGNRISAEEGGLTPQQIQFIENRDCEHFDAAEKAVLRLAEHIAMTNPDGRLDAEHYAELKDHFDDAQIFELGMVFAILAGMAKFLFVYDIAEKEDYCAFSS